MPTVPAKKPAPAPSEVTPEDAEDGSKKPAANQNVEQAGEGDINPLNPAGDSLDKLIKLRLNEDLYKAMLGELPCLETQEACIKELQTLAVANSKSLKAIDERVAIINQKIDEARRNNQRTINLSVFEPLVQSYLKIDTVTTVNSQGKSQTQTRGFFNKVLGIFSGIAGLNEVLSLVGVPLFKNLGGGDAAAQGRTIAIGDLQVKLAEIENKRGDLADKTREAVLIQVLDFDVARKDFQVSQEIARREVVRSKLREVDYRYSTTVTTDGYLSSLSGLDRTKADSYRQWARLRSQLARIKIIVLGDGS